MKLGEHLAVQLSISISSETFFSRLMDLIDYTHSTINPKNAYRSSTAVNLNLAASLQKESEFLRSSFALFVSGLVPGRQSIKRWFFDKWSVIKFVADCATA